MDNITSGTGSVCAALAALGTKHDAGISDLEGKRIQAGTAPLDFLLSCLINLVLQTKPYASKAFPTLGTLGTHTGYQAVPNSDFFLLTTARGPKLQDGRVRSSARQVFRILNHSALHR